MLMYHQKFCPLSGWIGIEDTSQLLVLLWQKVNRMFANVGDS
jgi:hypothetical protein